LKVREVFGPVFVNHPVGTLANAQTYNTANNGFVNRSQPAYNTKLQIVILTASYLTGLRTCNIW